jgi:hypothetical protein
MHNTHDQAVDTPTRTNAAAGPRVSGHDLPTVSPLPLMQLSTGLPVSAGHRKRFGLNC